MNIEDLKDQIAEEFNRIAGEIQDSSAYNSVREKFETLPTNIQKLIIGGAAAAVVLFILSIPLSFLNSASTYMAEFEEKRELSKELIQVSRAVQSGPRMSDGLNSGQLRSQVQRRIDQVKLIPEQIAGITPFNATEGGSLAPPGLQQEGVAVRLKKLNLRQLVDIGSMLQAVDPSVKMTGLEVDANKEDERYMDVTYQLVSYGAPAAGGPNEGKEPSPKGRQGGSN